MGNTLLSSAVTAIRRAVTCFRDMQCTGLSCDLIGRRVHTRRILPHALKTWILYVQLVLTHRDSRYIIIVTVVCLFLVSEYFRFQIEYIRFNLCLYVVSRIEDLVLIYGTGILLSISYSSYYVLRDWARFGRIL
jgi:hypothetical protein